MSQFDSLNEKDHTDKNSYEITTKNAKGKNETFKFENLINALRFASTNGILEDEIKSVARKSTGKKSEEKSEAVSDGAGTTTTKEG